MKLPAENIATNEDSMVWTEISLDETRVFELAASLERGPISLWWSEFDSSDSEEYEKLIALLTQPLTELADELPDVAADWDVVTTLNNHHRRLNPRIHFMLATVAPDEKTVYLTSTKQNDHTESSI